MARIKAKALLKGRKIVRKVLVSHPFWGSVDKPWRQTVLRVIAVYLFTRYVVKGFSKSLPCQSSVASVSQLNGTSPYEFLGLSHSVPPHKQCAIS
jgi:hypothetical protein